MSESVSGKHQFERLEEAKNIALGWRIVGQMAPQTLEEAIQMLQDSSAFAAQVHDLLSAELAAQASR